MFYAPETPVELPKSPLPLRGVAEAIQIEKTGLPRQACSLARNDGGCNEEDTLLQESRFENLKKWANELSNHRLREIKTQWTEEKRAEKKALIYKHKPWEASTGPKTPVGKTISSYNAHKHGLRSAEMKRLEEAMRAQSRFVREVTARFGLKKSFRLGPIMLESRMLTVSEILTKTRKRLEAAGVENAPLDARLLVRQGGNFTDSELISMDQTPLSAEVIDKIEKLVASRIAGEPVSRLLGGREFWGLPFKISPDTLDPRADTETLVEAALKWARTRYSELATSNSLRILDLGTGSGCILISLLKELPHATGVGIDLNPGAVSISRENAAALGVESRAEFRCGSWFKALQEGEMFDLIVSNPPYIPDSDIESLAVEVRAHDPILALSGGVDGLEAYKIILKNLKNYLFCGGRALFEIGQNQEKDLARLVDDSNMCVCDSYPDLAGILRVVEICHGEK